jgi:hypothetical protein
MRHFKVTINTDIDLERLYERAERFEAKDTKKRGKRAQRG